MNKKKVQILLADDQPAKLLVCVMRGPEQRFEFVNRRYLQLVGERELIGRPLRAAMPEIEGRGFRAATGARK
jgi:PAS domain-containing protein